MSFDLELTETNRLAGTVKLQWNAQAGATSYTIQNNEADLVTNATSPTTVSGLTVGTSYRFKVVANFSGAPAVQADEISFEFGTNESSYVYKYPWGNSPQSGYVLKY